LQGSVFSISRAVDEQYYRDVPGSERRQEERRFFDGTDHDG
jgi:hypothetical protein